MTVRILAVHPRDLAEPTGGGIQTFLLDFIGYAPDDFEISVAGVTADARSRPVGKWHILPVGRREARFLPVARAGSPWRHPLALLRTVPALGTLRTEMRHQGTILQLHRPFRPFLLDGHRGPRVQIIHLDLDAWPGPSGWRRLNWLYRDFGSGLDRFDRVFVANEPGAHKLRLENPAIAERIAFLPGWFDDRVFRPPAPDNRPALRARVASAVALPAEVIADRWVLWVGRLDPIKDPSLAVEAFAALRRSGQAQTRFIVCGDGDERAALIERADALGVAERIHLVGDQPRDIVADLMAAADSLLVTSIAEGGGPRVVLEALGSGLPVVSTVVGMVRRSVTSGVDGWLSEERTAESLAEGLHWTLEQPRDEIGAAAATAARPFVAAHVLQPLYDTYRTLTAGYDARLRHEAS